MGSKNRSIRFKIFLLLLLPLLMLSAMWGFALKLTVGDGVILMRSKTLYDTVGIASTDLGLQIQAERALTAGVLSSGQTNSAALTAQQAKTTASVDRFRRTAGEDSTRDAMGEDLVAPLESLLSSLERLPSIRESVSLGQMDRLYAINSYNAIMDDMFALYERLVSVPDLTVFQQASAMQGMGNAHEMISREDALIRGALASGVMTGEEQTAFSEWVSTRRFLYRKNRTVLTGDMRAPYEQELTSPLFDRFTALENLLVNRVRTGGPVPPEAQKWSPTVDQLILRLDSARVKASDALNTNATSVATGILLRILVAGGLGLVVIVTTIIFSVRFGRRLARDLAGLRDAALDLADVRLPRVVEKLRRGEEVDVEAEAPPINATGSSEVEDVAHAFGSVQRTAVEAAVGQAALRRGVGQVFLNLARRKQTLLHRQLTLLDSMQRRAEDPEALEDLFRLDHLTTRMRRHAEGLIILSGATPGRAWRKPVPLIDVVRAAISEVEDYTRVTMAPMPAATLMGASVADLVHLIAELIENATVFSPPHTRVEVRGELVANGLAIEVEDRGLGLSPEEYDEINARLTDPPEFDLADSDRLGLFVVSQLAARHGIRVVLRGSPFGGTTGIVLIPRTLVVEDGAPAAIEGPPAPRGAHAKPMPRAVHETVPDRVPDTFPERFPETAPETTPPTLREAVAGRVWEPDGASEFPESSPFFTPAALRTEAVPSSMREAPPAPTPLPTPFPTPVPTPVSMPESAPTNGAGNGSGNGAGNGAPNGSTASRARGSAPNGTHAGLPRRVRQANIAPQLRTPSTQPPLSAPPMEERSPEEARAVFAAFQSGARRGREDSDQPGGVAPGDHAHNTHGEKGDA